MTQRVAQVMLRSDSVRLWYRHQTSPADLKTLTFILENMRANIDSRLLIDTKLDKNVTFQHTLSIRQPVIPPEVLQLQRNAT